MIEVIVKSPPGYEISAYELVKSVKNWLVDMLGILMKLLFV